MPRRSSDPIGQQVERVMRGAGWRRMRAAGLTVAALLLALPGCGGAPEPAAPPRLSVAEPAHDFGQLPQGVPIEHEFDLVNAGGAPLTLIDLRTACDCAA